MVCDVTDYGPRRSLLSKYHTLHGATANAIYALQYSMTVSTPIFKLTHACGTTTFAPNFTKTRQTI
jgi:hypothetical protein